MTKITPYTALCDIFRCREQNQNEVEETDDEYEDLIVDPPPPVKVVQKINNSCQTQTARDYCFEKVIKSNKKHSSLHWDLKFQDDNFQILKPDYATYSAEISQISHFETKQNYVSIAEKPQECEENFTSKRKRRRLSPSNFINKILTKELNPKKCGLKECKENEDEKLTLKPDPPNDIPEENVAAKDIYPPLRYNYKETQKEPLPELNFNASSFIHKILTKELNPKKAALKECHQIEDEKPNPPNDIKEENVTAKEIYPPLRFNYNETQKESALPELNFEPINSAHPSIQRADTIEQKVNALYRTLSNLKDTFQKKYHFESDAPPEKCLCRHCGALAVVKESLKSPMIFDSNEEPEERPVHHKRKRIDEKEYIKLTIKLKTLEERLQELEELTYIQGPFKGKTYDMYTQCHSKKAKFSFFPKRIYPKNCLPFLPPNLKRKLFRRKISSRTIRSSSSQIANSDNEVRKEKHESRFTRYRNSFSKPKLRCHDYLNKSKSKENTDQSKHPTVWETNAHIQVAEFKEEEPQKVLSNSITEDQITDLLYELSKNKSRISEGKVVRFEINSKNANLQYESGVLFNKSLLSSSLLNSFKNKDKENTSSLIDYELNPESADTRILYKSGQAFLSNSRQDIIMNSKKICSSKENSNETSNSNFHSEFFYSQEESNDVDFFYFKESEMMEKIINIDTSKKSFLRSEIYQQRPKINEMNLEDPTSFKKIDQSKRIKTKENLPTFITKEIPVQEKPVKRKIQTNNNVQEKYAKSQLKKYTIPSNIKKQNINRKSITKNEKSEPQSEQSTISKEVEHLNQFISNIQPKKQKPKEAHPSKLPMKQKKTRPRSADVNQKYFTAGFYSKGINDRPETDNTKKQIHNSRKSAYENKNTKKSPTGDAFTTNKNTKRYLSPKLSNKSIIQDNKKSFQGKPILKEEYFKRPKSPAQKTRPQRNSSINKSKKSSQDFCQYVNKNYTDSTDTSCTTTSTMPIVNIQRRSKSLSPSYASKADSLKVNYKQTENTIIEKKRKCNITLPSERKRPRSQSSRRSADGKNTKNFIEINIQTCSSKSKKRSPNRSDFKKSESEKSAKSSKRKLDPESITTCSKAPTTENNSVKDSSKTSVNSVTQKSSFLAVLKKYSKQLLRKKSKSIFTPSKKNNIQHKEDNMNTEGHTDQLPTIKSSKIPLTITDKTRKRSRSPSKNGKSNHEDIKNYSSRQDKLMFKSGEKFDKCLLVRPNMIDKGTTLSNENITEAEKNIKLTMKTLILNDIESIAETQEPTTNSVFLVSSNVNPFCNETFDNCKKSTHNLTKHSNILKNLIPTYIHNDFCPSKNGKENKKPLVDSEKTQELITKNKPTCFNFFRKSTFDVEKINFRVTVSSKSKDDTDKTSSDYTSPEITSTTTKTKRKTTDETTGASTTKKSTPTTETTKNSSNGSSPSSQYTDSETKKYTTDYSKYSDRTSVDPSKYGTKYTSETDVTSTDASKYSKRDSDYYSEATSSDQRRTTPSTSTSYKEIKCTCKAIDNVTGKKKCGLESCKKQNCTKLAAYEEQMGQNIEDLAECEDCTCGVCVKCNLKNCPHTVGQQKKECEKCECSTSKKCNLDSCSKNPKECEKCECTSFKKCNKNTCPKNKNEFWKCTCNSSPESTAHTKSSGVKFALGDTIYDIGSKLTNEIKSMLKCSCEAKEVPKKIKPAVVPEKPIKLPLPEKPKEKSLPTTEESTYEYTETTEYTEESPTTSPEPPKQKILPQRSFDEASELTEDDGIYSDRSCECLFEYGKAKCNRCKEKQRHLQYVSEEEITNSKMGSLTESRTTRSRLMTFEESQDLRSERESRQNSASESLYNRTMSKTTSPTRKSTRTSSLDSSETKKSHTKRSSTKSDDEPSSETKKKSYGSTKMSSSKRSSPETQYDSSSELIQTKNKSKRSSSKPSSSVKTTNHDDSDSEELETNTNFSSKKPCPKISEDDDLSSEELDTTPCGRLPSKVQKTPNSSNSRVMVMQEEPKMKSYSNRNDDAFKQKCVFEEPVPLCMAQTPNTSSESQNSKQKARFSLKRNSKPIPEESPCLIKENESCSLKQPKRSFFKYRNCQDERIGVKHSVKINPTESVKSMEEEIQVIRLGDQYTGEPKECFLPFSFPWCSGTPQGPACIPIPKLPLKSSLKGSMRSMQSEDLQYCQKSSERQTCSKPAFQKPSYSGCKYGHKSCFRPIDSDGPCVEKESECMFDFGEPEPCISKSPKQSRCTFKPTLYDPSPNNSIQMHPQYAYQRPPYSEPEPYQNMYNSPPYEHSQACMQRHSHCIYTPQMLDPDGQPCMQRSSRCVYSPMKPITHEMSTQSEVFKPQEPEQKTDNGTKKSLLKKKEKGIKGEVSFVKEKKIKTKAGKNKQILLESSSSSSSLIIIPKRSKNKNYSKKSVHQIESLESMETLEGSSDEIVVHKSKKTKYKGPITKRKSQKPGLFQKMFSKKPKKPSKRTSYSSFGYQRKGAKIEAKCKKCDYDGKGSRTIGLDPCCEPLSTSPIGGIDKPKSQPEMSKPQSPSKENLRVSFPISDTTCGRPGCKKLAKCPDAFGTESGNKASILKKPYSEECPVKSEEESLRLIAKCSLCEACREKVSERLFEQEGLKNCLFPICTKVKDKIASSFACKYFRNFCKRPPDPPDQVPGRIREECKNTPVIPPCCNKPNCNFVQNICEVNNVECKQGRFRNYKPRQRTEMSSMNTSVLNLYYNVQSFYFENEEDWDWSYSEDDAILTTEEKKKYLLDKLHLLHNFQDQIKNNSSSNYGAFE